MSMEEIAATREEKLTRLLRHCSENVPYYRRFFAERGIDPEELRTIDQVREAGISTTKEILRSEREALIAPEFNRDDLSHYSTSGSTGDPVLIYMTSDQYARRDARKYRVEDWIGKNPGTRATVIWGRHRHYTRAKMIKNYFFWKIRNYQFLSAFETGDENLLRQVESIRKHRSRFIEAYVSVLYEMGLVIERHGITPPPLDGVITGAEVLFDHQRELMEKSFQCPVYNRYGSTEFKSIASECLNRNGMHINEDSLIVEVVDDDDRPVVGEPGNIVITDLENLALPMIRYRIGDIGVLSEEPCGCGRNFRTLDKVTGRDTDRLYYPDGSTITSMIVVWKFIDAPGVRRYQAIQRSLSELDLKVVADGTEPLDAMEAWIYDRFFELRENGMSVSLEFVDQIPRTKAGKMTHFVPLPKKDAGK